MSAVQTIKGYELHERIGSGGFGVVHRAIQSTIGREVAIKIILPHFANQPDFIRRFETEAQIIARLEHLHIVPLYDYWRDPDGAYLVMRWLRGGNLREALANNPFDLEVAALLVDQVAAALAVAHRNGVIHRDLKPANILLDEDGNAYLSDFGIAKDAVAADSILTGTGMVLGSPDYLSPEQVRSDPVTPQTDIYSLGVMLYELLTGEHPFPNCSSVERMYKHLNEPLPLITCLPPDVVDGINGIVQKATAKNPAQRYTDVLALAADFRREVALTRQTGDKIIEQLTFREQEILQMIVEGCSNKEIAQRLFVTVATVKWHIHGVYQKLRVRSRVQAVARARELNLVVSDSTAEPTVIDSAFVMLAEPENPYKGLRAFQLADAHDFFGRERLIQRIVHRLGERDKLARFLAIIGPSGSGKSSVVKAGVIPALWRGDLRGSDRWFVIEMKPGEHPLDELEIALTRVAADQTANLREHLERDKRGLVRIARLILPADESELVIVIDQFEEIFTLVEDEAKRAQFIDLIYQSIIDPSSRVRVIITLRADFYDRPLQYADFGELVRSRMETVLPLSLDELEAAIAKPAARVGVAFEPGLVSTIAEDVHYQPGALPLLQYALTELFEQRVKHMLTHEAYAALGRAAGALAKRAEDLYHEQVAAGHEAIRQMFLRLISLGEGVEDTRRRVLRSDLLALSDSDLMDEILDTYVGYRLLTLDHDPATRRPTVEIAHEAILREWDRLRSWLNESRNDIRQQRLLSAAAADWVQAGRDMSYLLRGARLEQMVGWAAESRLALTPDERGFLKASITERQQQENAEHERQQRELETQTELATQQQRAANRLRYLVAGLTGFLVIVLLLLLYALDQQRQTELARQEAQRAANINHSLVLANSAVQTYENGDTVLATLLALEALNMDEPPTEAAITFREIAQGVGIRAVLEGGPYAMTALALSIDGRFAMSGGCADLEADQCTIGKLILWDLQTQDEIQRLEGHTDWVNGLEFSPDSQTAISGAADGSAALWSIPSGELIRRFEGHTAGINSIAISPDGETFVSASDDGTLIRWNIRTGEVIRKYEGHTDAVDCVVFSPDGQTLLSGSADMTMIRWDVTSGERLVTFEEKDARVTGVAFVPGDRAVSVTRAGGLYLWDAITGEQLRERTFIGNPPDLILSPNGRTVFFGELGTVRAWNIDQWQAQYDLSFYASRKQHVASLAMSAGSSLAGYGTIQGELVLWDLPSTGQIRRYGDSTAHYTFGVVSPDNQYLLLGTDQGEVIVHDRVSGAEIRRFIGVQGWVWRIVFSPDGKQVLIAVTDWFGGSGQGSLMLWDMESGDLLQSFGGFEYLPVDTSFSADGKVVLLNTSQWGNAWSESYHGETIAWDAVTGNEVLRLDSDVWLNASFFTEDGHYIITGSGTEGGVGVIVWDTETGKAVRHFMPNLPITDLIPVTGTTYTLAGTGGGEIILLDYVTGEEIRRFCCHNNWVRYLDLSADQRYVISADQSAVVVLWDFATGQEVRRFYGHEGFSWAVVFSPDGQTAFSAGMDGSVIEWQIADPSLNELISWVRANRYIPEFTCEDRVRYRIEPLCGK